MMLEALKVEALILVVWLDICAVSKVEITRLA